jgi:amino acid permease
MVGVMVISITVVIIIIIIPNHSENIRATYWESTKLWNHKKTALLGTAHILREVLM